MTELTLSFLPYELFWALHIIFLKLALLIPQHSDKENIIILPSLPNKDTKALRG
jgi:hypothetical protein